MTDHKTFIAEVEENIRGLRDDKDVQALARIFCRSVAKYRYTYNFRWMGRPIIQLPQDMIAMQELVFQVQPKTIVETGVAHGGSAIYYASLLELLGGERKVIGVDVEIRPHNRAAIDDHPMRKRIELVEGSSTAPDVVLQVFAKCNDKGPTIVCLDSDHTHDHVLAELRAYAPLVKKGSYIVVMDTLIEDLPADLFEGKRWGPGNNPKTAVAQFLAENPRFEVDQDIDAKLLLTVAPGGWLRCKEDP